MLTPIPRSRPVVILLILVTGLTWGCATMRPPLEAPQVSLVNISQLPSTGMETAFLMELRLINPNDMAINLKGIDCRLEINDSTIASGVSNEEAWLPRLGWDTVGSGSAFVACAATSIRRPRPARRVFARGQRPAAW